MGNLAEKTGISPNTVSWIEGGLTEMYVETFWKLAQVLGADAGSLLCQEEKPDSGDRAHKKHFKPHEPHGKKGAGSCGADGGRPGGCFGKEPLEVKTDKFNMYGERFPLHLPGKIPCG